MTSPYLDGFPLERPKGMRKAMWSVILAERARAALPQTHIVWLYRGFPIQWARGPLWGEGPMLGVEDDGCFRAGLPLGKWHAALVDAMHWHYDPTEKPPHGWRLATAEDMQNLGPDTQVVRDEEAVND